MHDALRMEQEVMKKAVLMSLVLDGSAFFVWQWIKAWDLIPLIFLLCVKKIHLPEKAAGDFPGR